MNENEIIEVAIPVSEATEVITDSEPELVITFLQDIPVGVFVDDLPVIDVYNPEIVIIRGGSGAVDSVNGMTGTVVLGYNHLATKPFASIDTNTMKVENGVLKVNTTNNAESDNTKPITSSGVHTIVGNIETILATI